MLIQNDAWRLIIQRDLGAAEIQEVAEQGLGSPEARWLYEDAGISLSDVEFYLHLKAAGMDRSDRLAAWKGRRDLYGVPALAAAELTRIEAPADDLGSIHVA